MGDVQIKKSSKVYDVVIVGLGAGGGMAGYILASAGAKVLMLKAGPYFDPAKHPAQLKFTYQFPRRNAATKERAGGDFNAAFGGWVIDGEPYTKKDNTEFDWFRSRMTAGRTNHWGRISLRFGPKDFQPDDGAPTVQQSDKNATWTILALSMRTAEYILERKGKQNIA